MVQDQPVERQGRILQQLSDIRRVSPRHSSVFSQAQLKVDTVYDLLMQGGSLSLMMQVIDAPFDWLMQDDCFDKKTLLFNLLTQGGP